MADKVSQTRFQWGGLGLGRFSPTVALIFFLPILFFILLSTYVNLRSVFAEVRSQYQLPALHRRASETANLALSALLEKDPADRILALGAVVAPLRQEPTIEDVSVMDTTGALVFDSEGRRLPPERDTAVLALAEPVGTTVPGTKKGSFHFLQPIGEKTPVGYLKVGYSRKSLEAPLGHVRNRIIINTLLLLMGATVLLFLLTERMTRPFHEIVLDALKVTARQNLSGRVSEKGFGEIKVLQKAYNRLKDALEEMLMTRSLLGKFVQPQVAEMILDGKIDVEPQKRRISVLYIDIEKFTDFTARHEAPEVARMVAEFWGLVEGAVTRFAGTIDKHVGDAVIGIWNAPLDQPDAPLRAVKCVFEINRTACVWNQKRKDAGQEEIRFWVSVATGSCVVGKMGHERMEYTALGNTMNIAPRIMSKAHDLSAHTTIDGFTHDAVKEHVGVKALGVHRLRGIKDPIRIFELLKEN